MGRSRSRSRSRSRDRHRRRRSRSRSRSRDRRRRSRSRERGRSRYDRDRGAAPSGANMAPLGAAAHQAALAQQIMAQQLMGVQQAAAAAAGPAAAAAAGIDAAAITLDRKQREVYVGNLAIGIINAKLLEEFFNQALSHMMADPIATPPVININMDSQGRFAFVEFRTRELANQGLLMDKMVDVCGRHLHIGRPKGYMEPTGPPLPLSIAAPQAPQADGTAGPATQAAAGGGAIGAIPPSRALLLSAILPVGHLREADARQGLLEDVQEEAALHGTVDGVAVPPPPATVQDRGPGRAYILYKTVEDAEKGLKVFNTRTLDDYVIKAQFVSLEEYELAARGVWAPRHASVAGIPLPGLYTLGNIVTGVTGLTALNPALAAAIQTNPGIAAAMHAAIDEAEVPYEEGWVKLRGFPPVVTKAHIMQFFAGCGKLTESDVRAVHAADGTPLGEAFVHLHGPEGKLRLALARDRSPLPPINTPAEVLTSSEADMERRGMSGCVLL